MDTIIWGISVRDWLGVLKFLFTFLTFIVAVVVQRKISRINRRHLFKKLVPGHIKNLREIGKNINLYLLQGFNENGNLLRREVSKSRIELKYITSKLNYSSRFPFYWWIWRLRLNGLKTKQDADIAYDVILKCETELIALQKEFNNSIVYV
ncbi:MAG: hypothetical protein V4658_04030 [Bacteroidota bacterium]